MEHKIRGIGFRAVAQRWIERHPEWSIDANRVKITRLVGSAFNLIDRVVLFYVMFYF